MMSRDIHYGENTTLHLQLPEHAWCKDFSSPKNQALANPKEAIAEALAAPLGLPPLSQNVFPGDRVALAVDRDLPDGPLLVSGVIQVLIDAGVSSTDIAIVQARASDGDRLLSELPTALRRDIGVEVHTPRDVSQLTYVAATKEGRPVYVNRTIGDADVILPLETIRAESSFAYLGIHGGLYPGFSDEPTRVRFREPQSSPSALHKLRIEIEEVVWLLGCTFTINALPGPRGKLAAILAGELQAVGREGQRRCEEAWRCESPQRARLVLAALDGGQDQQTWANLGRALFAASQAVTPDGAIVLCTELRQRPGPALKQLAAMEQGDRLPRKGFRPSADARCAALLHELRQHVRLYLLSDLESELVENLGLAYIEDPADIESLCRRQDSFILLGNAQYATLTIPE